MFIDLNPDTWAPGPPEVEDSVDAMLQIAAHTVDVGWFALVGSSSFLVGFPRVSWT